VGVYVGVCVGVCVSVSVSVSVRVSLCVRIAVVRAISVGHTQSPPITVQLKLSPEIRLQPLSTMAELGHDVHLSVQGPYFGAAAVTRRVCRVTPLGRWFAARAYPPPTYQWLLNGAPVPGATTSALVIHSLSPAQVGQYTCVVHCGKESVTSSVAEVRLDGGVPVVTRQPESVSAREGDAVELSAEGA
jgi:hypothetical protein